VMVSNRDPDRFVSIQLGDLVAGDPLPCTVFLYIDFRFITFRAQGDVVDRVAYDRLQFKKVKTLFIQEADRKAFEAWIMERVKTMPPVKVPPVKEFAEAREDAYRRTLDIFQSEHPDKIVKQALMASKNLVKEVMRYPYAIRSLTQLQTYSRGTVDHSVNVSILATYLAMQIGYTHKLILQHVGVGGLLHDVGKTRIPISDSDTPDVVAIKLKAHPEIGATMLESQVGVPKEVKLIVAQHHESYDGTGYPKKLRGAAIYDLARIVSIANVFDELVSGAAGPLLERQRYAVKQLDQVHYRQFDPQKLNKCLKVLKMGI
jgi:putative nucleotidyltransferase with HDIG domain